MIGIETPTMRLMTIPTVGDSKFGTVHVVVKGRLW